MTPDQSGLDTIFGEAERPPSREPPGRPGRPGGPGHADGGPDERPEDGR